MGSYSASTRFFWVLLCFCIFNCGLTISAFGEQIVATYDQLYPTQMEIGVDLVHAKETKWFRTWIQNQLPNITSKTLIKDLEEYCDHLKQIEDQRLPEEDPSLLKKTTRNFLSKNMLNYLAFVKAKLNAKAPGPAILGPDKLHPNKLAVYPLDGHHRLAQGLMAQKRVHAFNPDFSHHDLQLQMHFTIRHKLKASSPDRLAHLIFDKLKMGRVTKSYEGASAIEKFNALPKAFTLEHFVDNPWRSAVGAFFQEYKIEPTVDLVPYAEFLIAEALESSGIKLNFSIGAVHPKNRLKVAKAFFENKAIKMHFFKYVVLPGHETSAKEMIRNALKKYRLKLCESGLRR